MPWVGPRPSLSIDMSDEAPAADAAAEAAAPPTKKGKPGLILIGALVGGLVAGAAAGLFAVGPMVARSSGYAVTEEMQTRLKAQARLVQGAEGDDEEGEGEDSDAHATGEDATAGEEGDHAPKEGEPAPGGNLHLIDNLVMNPAGSGGTRFLMLSTAIEFRDGALVEQFKARDAEVRDLVLRVMGAKSVEQLADMPLREQIRKEMTDSLSMLVPKKDRKKAIVKIYFPQFVIQ
jgi:flagellar FliL protein